MTTAQKKQFLNQLDKLADNIEDMKASIVEATVRQSAFYTSAPENIAIYAIRLREYLAEKGGILLTLNLFGYHVKWENDRPVNIEKMTD